MKLKYLTVILFIILTMCLVAFGIKTSVSDKNDEHKSSPGEKTEIVVLHNTEEVSEKINEALDGKSDGTISLNISNDISDDELKKVNLAVNSMKGSIKSITIYNTNTYDLSESYREVEFDYVRSDTMYVYDSIVNNADIPEDKIEALKLRNVCQSFISQNISEYMTDYDKELAIHDYIINNCEYGFSDNNDDSEYSAYGALVNGKAVCSGYAAATNLLLMCVGIDSNVITGLATNLETGETENHAWNQVKIGGEWYHLDTTWDDPVGVRESMIHEFFNVSDDIIDDTHEWDKNNATMCSSMKYNYYIRKGAYIYDVNSLENYCYTQLTTGNDDYLECALKNVDVTDETLQFLFNYDMVETISYSTDGTDEYKILSVYINQ